MVHFQDNKISEEEWTKMWAHTIPTMDDSRPLPEWQQKYMDFMFDVNDTSGGGATIKFVSFVLFMILFPALP